MTSEFVQKKIKERKANLPTRAKKKIKVNTARTYVRKEIYSVDDVFAHVPTERLREETFAIFDGDKISMGSQRYKLFKKSCVCVTCGFTGTYFAKERNSQHPSNGRYHFNLYGKREDGTEVMLTKDHIVPKSKGGPDDASNYQTMCEPCNKKKGNSFIEENVLRTVALAIQSTSNVWIDEPEEGVINFCRHGHPHMNEPKVVVLETHYNLDDEKRLNDAHLRCVNRLRAAAAIVAYDKAVLKYAKGIE